MPSPNIIRHDLPDGIYHVYSRGVNKQTIFRDKDDFEKFRFYLARYLAPYESGRRARPNYSCHVQLLCFVQMDNHFHLLLKQRSQGAMAKLMRCLANSYVRYFNEKYGRVGPLFQSRYKASHIDNEPYWLHISKYIHRNPGSPKTYPHSSFPSYEANSFPNWIDSKPLLDSFQSHRAYTKFVEE